MPYLFFSPRYQEVEWFLIVITSTVRTISDGSVERFSFIWVYFWEDIVVITYNFLFVIQIFVIWKTYFKGL